MSVVLRDPSAHGAATALQVRQCLDLAGVMRWVVVALVPAAVMGLWNTGYQANAVLARLGLETAEGWRGAVIAWLGTGYLPGSTTAAVMHGALYLVPLFVVATGVAFAWEYLFARTRRRSMGEGTLVTALVFTLLLPPAAPLWQCALGISFAMVFGKLIFGGTGATFSIRR